VVFSAVWLLCCHVCSMFYWLTGNAVLIYHAIVNLRLHVPWFDVCWNFGVVGLEWYPCWRLKHNWSVHVECWGWGLMTSSWSFILQPLGEVCVRHVLREIHFCRSFHYSSLIITEAYKRTHLYQIDNNIIKATNSYFGPKHVGFGVFHIRVIPRLTKIIRSGHIR